MGFWAKLFGREVDTTVTDYQAKVASAADGESPVAGTRVGRSIGGAVRFPVEDVFVIQGRGTVVTGTLEVGTVSVGDVLEWRLPDGRAMSASISGVEAFRKHLESVGPGEKVGLLLRGVERADIPAGTVLTR